MIWTLFIIGALAGLCAVGILGTYKGPAAGLYAVPLTLVLGAGMMVGAILLSQGWAP